MDPSRVRDFTAFYDATWARTVACAYAMTGVIGDAEDLAQEAYSRAWPRWSSLREYDDPGGVGSSGGDPAGGLALAAGPDCGGVPGQL